MVKARIIAVVLVTGCMVFLGIVPVNAASPVYPASNDVVPVQGFPSFIVEQPTPRMVEVKKKMKQLKLPVADTKTRKHDEEMKRAACVWRDLVKEPVNREKLTKEEKTQIMTMTVLPVPKRLVTGLNIDKTCQVVVWVAVNQAGERYVKRIMPASTGEVDSTTPNGRYRIYRETNRWHESTSYPGAMMYRPKYFRGGVAFHGSATDWYVRPYPASKGCVRMFHKDIDRLWKSGLSIGTEVKVYGRWVR